MAKRFNFKEALKQLLAKNSNIKFRLYHVFDFLPTREKPKPDRGMWAVGDVTIAYTDTEHESGRVTRRVAFMFRSPKDSYRHWYSEYRAACRLLHKDTALRNDVIYMHGPSVLAIDGDMDQIIRAQASRKGILWFLNDVKNPYIV